MKNSAKLLLMVVIGIVITPPSDSCWSQETLEGHTVSIGGMEMYYETHGQDSPLILLHGITQSGQIWRSHIVDLAEHYRLIIPDLRGHGRSTNPLNQFTTKQSALDIFALLDQLEIDQFKAMGISAGGMTLIHMATQQPERVEAMVLIGATTYHPEQARVLYSRSADSLSTKQWARYRRHHKQGDEQIRALVTQFDSWKDNYDDMNFTKPYLSTITARTLILHGDRDHFFPVSIPVEMYQAIPRSYLWIVPNGGHIPIGGNRAEVFRRTALEFLQGDWESK